MDAYFKRRIVNWLCVQIRQGLTLPQIIAKGSERQPPFPEEWIRDMMPHAKQGCANAAALNAANPWSRLCDVCKILPEKQGD